MVAEDAHKAVLKVEHVAKSFRLPTEQASGVKQLIINWTKGIKGYRDQEVLHDISFEVKQGDFFGIVGRNGSGKSTLLKLISGIYVPDAGSITIDGKLVPFIELGVGFNPELTGRENVYLNGALLGFSTEEIDAMYDDIVGFAELEDFMDQKLKNYSSGMQVRLAFSLAIRARGDILVLDEVLAVGDEAFQKKCQDFFFQAKRERKTIILVTHSMDSVRIFCDKAMMIESGRIVKIGNPDDVANTYSNLFFEEQKKEMEQNNRAVGFDGGECVHLKRIRVCSEGLESELLDIHEPYSLEAVITCDRPIEGGVFAINLIDEQGRVAVAASTRPLKDKALFSMGEHVVQFDFENDLPFGTFQINVAFAEGHNLLMRKEHVYSFGVKKDEEYNQVLMHPKVCVRVD